MKIENHFPTVTTENLRPTSRARRTPPVPARPAFERTHDLTAELAGVPDVRADAVARGKALIADPNYPSPQQIKSVARVLAARWSDTDSKPAA